jgi:hypothetical protein
VFPRYVEPGTEAEPDAKKPKAKKG